MAEPTTTPRPVRRATGAVLAVFFLNGFLFASWASRLPAVRDALDVTPGQIGLVLLVGAAGSVVALPLTGAVIERLGTTLTNRLAAALTAAGFVAALLAVAAGSAPAVAACLFVATMGIGAWDVAMNLQGAVVEQALGRAIMPRFHGAFSLGAVAGAGVGTVAAAVGVPVSWHVIAAVVACAGAVVAVTARYLPDRAVETAPTPEGSGSDGAGRRSAFDAWREPRTVLIGLLVFSAALTEGSANDWLALAVVDGFAVSDALGALAFGVFVAAMTAMRFAGTVLLDRFGRVRVLRVCAATGLVGLLVFGVVGSPVLALAGAALWGVGAALGFPVGMSAASDEPARAAARVSVVSTIGYVAFLAGPPLLGMLADHVGYRGALLVIAAPLVLSFALSGIAAPLPGAVGSRTPDGGPPGGLREPA